MWKRLIVSTMFIATSCVTVNIYFPAAAVERAADEIVKETWGGPGEAPQNTPPQTTPPPGSRLPLSFVTEAYAAEPDIDISNPAIRALKDSIKTRSDSIKPYMDRGNVGITRDGLLAVRSTDGLSLNFRVE